MTGGIKAQLELVLKIEVVDLHFVTDGIKTDSGLKKLDS